MRSLAWLLLSTTICASGSPVQRQRRGVYTLHGAARESLAERHLSPEALRNHLAILANNTVAKYSRNIANYHANLATLSERAVSASTVALTDLYSSGIDTEYYGPLGIGTNIQTIQCDFDTGSSDLWVPLTTCGNCRNDGTRFNAAASSTYRGSSTPFSVRYGSGQVSGTVANDVVHFGSLTDTVQYFGAVTSVSSSFDNTPVTGLAGLAYQSIAATGKPSIPFNLANEGQLAAPVFGIRLPHATSVGAELTIGGIAADYAGSTFAYTPITSQTYYEVGCTGMVVNGHVVGGSFPAAIDTGTTLLYVPKSVATAFYAQIPQAQLYMASSTQSIFVYPCSFSGTIGVSFAGIGTLNFNAADLNAGPVGSGYCEGAVAGLNIRDTSGNYFGIIGDTFIKSYYTLFDFGSSRIGFTPAKANT